MHNSSSPRTVLATGVFDLLHPGHLHYLSEAAKLGDRLVVIVAHDETVRRKKDVAVFSAEDRREMVAALRVVDEAVIGNPGDHFRIVSQIKPAIIALGYDQAWQEADLKQALDKAGLPAIEVVRIGHAPHQLGGSRHIIAKIKTDSPNH